MKLFKCENCGSLLHFENRTCESCGYRLGYEPLAASLLDVDQQGDTWQPLSAPDRRYRFCANMDMGQCNWLVDASSPEHFCLACRHNRNVPNLSAEVNLARWRKLEIAKRRLFYTLLRFGLPLANRIDDPAHGLTFDFLADGADEKVLTGHDEGIITINLNEADDATREKMRVMMGERYRTLLGHFRHEVGHHFWDLLVRDKGEQKLEEFRAVFGDERPDYQEALNTHYNQGPPPDWQDHFISSYASAHPWEDFAETWAHYLHMVDTLEMGSALGLEVHPRIDPNAGVATELVGDPYKARRVEDLVDGWLSLTFAVNSVNRCMGQPDLYPFILRPGVIKKLAFIHALVHSQTAEAAPAPPKKYALAPS